MRVRKRDVVRALRAARGLALLACDAESIEGRAHRYRYFDWRRRLQREARRLERLTHELGITEAPDGDEDEARQA